LSVLHPVNKIEAQCCWDNDLNRFIIRLRLPAVIIVVTLQSGVAAGEKAAARPPHSKRYS
jgi:hypothetical protein